MLLSRRDIIRRIKKGDIVFSPAVSAIDQVSVDLRIGRLFTKFVSPAHAAAIRFSRDLFLDPELWKTEEKDSYFIKPGEFILAKTHEFVQLPYDLTGLINGRSSYARIGLGVHLTAPKIDPGFKGTITLELTNVGETAIELRAGVDAPCQLMFLLQKTAVTEAESYGSSEEDIFAGQTEPVPVKPRKKK